MKESKIKTILYPTLSLFLICLVSVILLAGVNELTKDKIAENNKSKEDILRQVVFPDADKYSEKADYVECLDKDGNIVGYIFTTADTGYGGDITVLTGINTNGVVTGVAVANHTETPTVGGKAIDEGLADQYKNKQATTFEVGKNIDGVTGVTRTAKGVAGAVNKAVEKYNSIKGGGN